MEFEYTSSIYIEEKDLEEIVNRVKQGEDFVVVYDSVMMAYDDCDYYNRDLIENKVREEIERRMK